MWRKRDLTGITASDLIPQRTNARPGTRINGDTAMRNSAAWACVRLRADLMSSFPIDVYRTVDGRQVEVPKPTVLTAPGGPRCRVKEWVYSTQVDLDRYGNTFGIISARDGNGLPAQIDLVCASDVTVKVRGGALAGYRIGQTTYDPPDVWHEKQYTVAGLHVGLSPVAYAAWCLGQYASVQQFALDWFDNGTLPSATLRNTQKVVPPKQAAEIKDVYRASVERGDVFVHGADWEFKMLNSQAAGSNWLESQNASLLDICRFFGCPGDTIDVAVSGQAVTYANITQRNLQLLILNLGPAVGRREEAWSWGLVPAPRYVKLATNALLRMDPASQSTMLGQQLRDRMITPTEVRALFDRLPYTEAQYAEFIKLYGDPLVVPPKTKENAAPAAGVNLRIDAPITLPPVILPPITMPAVTHHIDAPITLPAITNQPADVRITNEITTPPQPAPVVTVNVPETTIRIVDGDDDDA